MADEIGMVERVSKPGRYFTGKPCPKGHVCERYSRNRECVECSAERLARAPNKAERTRKSAERNKESRRVAAQAARDADRGRSREISLRSYYKNRDKILEWQKLPEVRAKRSELVRNIRLSNPEGSRAAGKKWRQSNPGKVVALAARRRATKINATPPWADYEKIDAVYLEARSKTALSGIPHHVDHIVPLRGKHVCGLHVHWNLQILTATENCRKHNKFDDAIDAALSEDKPTPTPTKNGGEG